MAPLGEFPGAAVKRPAAGGAQGVGAQTGCAPAADGLNPGPETTPL